MTFIRKAIPVAMIMIMLVSLLVPTALAANTTDSSYYILSTEYDYRYASQREKQDESAVYAKITKLTLNDTVKAQVVGSPSEYGVYTNCTLSNNADTEFVTLSKNINYSIHNMIKERGNNWAKIGFQSNLIMGTINEGVEGWWSPDSSRTHTSATR